MRWLDGITDLMDTNLSKLRVGDGQGILECCSPWGQKESDTTEQLNRSKSVLGVLFNSCIHSFSYRLIFYYVFNMEHALPL